MTDSPHPPALSVRPAAQRDLPRVWRLTHDVYTAEGYCAPSPDGELRHYDRLDICPETTVFLVELGGDLLGTISVTLDSKNGLHTDHAFALETDSERDLCDHSGLTLAASWRIVTAPDCRERSGVVRALVTRTLHHLEMSGVDVLLCTFNPRHERAWARMLGLATIAGPRPDPSVSNAPAVLMRGHVPALIRRWRERHP